MVPDVDELAFSLSRLTGKSTGHIGAFFAELMAEINRAA
jgi:hypothetical protein